MMRRTMLGAGLALLLFLVLHVPALAQPATPQDDSILAAAAPPFVAGEITVGVADDFVWSAGSQVFGLELLDTFPLMEPIAVESAGGLSHDRPTAHVLLLKTEPGAELAEVERLASLPGVHFALPNWTAHAATVDPALIANDPLYLNEQWYAQRVSAARAWGLAQELAGGLDRLTNVRVAVIDSGIDFDHPDLAGRLLPGWNYVNPGTTPQDDFGHGTHMTGLIAAQFNNGFGMAGLAPAVEILPYRALNHEGTGRMSDVAQAINAAANSNARIINLSLFLNNPHPLLEDAIHHAYSRGVLLIASAGNCVLGEPCPVPVRYPAAYPEVMAVGATTLHDVRAFYSAVGMPLDITAPGGDVAARILSTWPHDLSLRCGAESFRLEGNAAYCLATGTSSAAAIVSGAAALLLSVQPDLPADAVRAILATTAHPLPLPQTETGAGRLDLAAALRYIAPAELDIWPNQIAQTFSAPITLPAGTGLGDVHTLAPPVLPDRLRVVTHTLTIANPSLSSVTWQASVEGAPAWLHIAGSAGGIVRFEEPKSLTLVISPTTDMVGSFQAHVRVVGTRLGGSQIVRSIPVQLTIRASTIPPLYVPALAGNDVPPASPQTPFTWEQPGAGHAREVYSLTDSSVATVALPFPVIIKGRTLDDFRLTSDGYISFPAGENDPGVQNRCLRNFTRPSHVIAGWWADLNPGAFGSRVSTFISDRGHFVVEYLRVPLRAAPTLNVSFQIVMTADGGIGLNYLHTPGASALAASNATHATVGVAAQYGRFYRQLYCSQGQTQTGQLPQSGQSFWFQPDDIY